MSQLDGDLFSCKAQHTRRSFETTSDIGRGIVPRIAKRKKRVKGGKESRVTGLRAERKSGDGMWAGEGGA